MVIIVSDNNIKNGKIVDMWEADEDLRKNPAHIYEVIRVIDKKPIFAKEHYDRMVRSSKLCDVEFDVDYATFKKYVELLIDNNDITLNCFRNVVLKTDHCENIKPIKTQEKKKIDGVISKIMALGAYLTTPHYSNTI